MVLEGLRLKFLKRKIRKTRGARRAAFEREITSIESKRAFEKEVASRRQTAFRQEQLRTAAEIGKAKARTQAQAQIKSIQQGGGKGGLAAGIDKFLAGTGVAKGTAKVVGGGFGGGAKFDPIGSSGMQRKRGFKVI